MSIAQEWIAWMGFMFVIFLVGVFWARKERRDRAQSSSQRGKDETTSGQRGTNTP